MKKETLYIILAFVIGAIISFFCVRKAKSSSNNLENAVGKNTGKRISPVKAKLAKLMKQSWGKDTSKDADLAEICTPDALKMAYNANSIYILCDSENKEDKENPCSYYEMWTGPNKNNRKHHYISERTFNALISAGVEPDYN